MLVPFKHTAETH